MTARWSLARVIDSVAARLIYPTPFADAVGWMSEA
jgi:hypothetical protein